MEELDKQIAAYEYTEPTLFEEQIKIDEERLFQEYMASIEAEPVEEITVPYEDIDLESDLQIHLWERCNFHSIDFWLALALMESESTYNYEAVNGDSKGLMQINRCWWGYYKELDVNSPYDNIEIGLLILEDLLTKYDELTAIHMYKCGEGRGQELLDKGIIITQAQWVIDRAEEMRKSHATEEVTQP